MPVASPARPRGPACKNHRMVYGWIGDEHAAAFERAAAADGLHFDVFVAKMLTAVAVELAKREPPAPAGRQEPDAT